MSPIQATQNDFAASLLINKMANGQIQSTSGKTVTTANVKQSALLSEKAAKYNDVSNGLLEGVGYTMARQNTLQEVKSILEDIGNIASKIPTGTVTTGGELAAAANSISGLTANLDKLLGGTYALAGTTGEVGLFGANTVNFDAGLIAGTAAGVLTVGGTDVGDTTKLLGATNGAFLTNAGAAGTTTGAMMVLLSKAMDDILAGLDLNIEAAGADFNMINNRSMSVDDIVQNFQVASNSQDSITGTGVGGLLATVLGTNQV